jgi:small subunit ribosomal protein S6
MHCLYLGKPGIVAELERNLKMIDSVLKFQSVKIAEDVDLDARQVEADVKIAPVEDEKPREERGEFAPGEEGFEADAPEAREE